MLVDAQDTEAGGLAFSAKEHWIASTKIKVGVLMQFQPTRHPLDVAPLLYFGQRYGIVRKFRRLFVGENTMVQNQGDIANRHDVVQFSHALGHENSFYANTRGL
jgi:hypothetical protein